MTFKLVRLVESNVVTMGFKCVIVLIAVLSLQGLIHADYVAIQPILHHQPILKTANNARASISELSINFTSEVKRTGDQVRDIGRQQYNKFTSELEHLKQATFFEINALSEDNDIDVCIKDAIPRIRDLVGQAQMGVVLCFADFLGEFMKFYETLLEAIRQGFDNIYALAIQYDECEDWQCRATVAQQLSQEMMRFKGEVRIIVDQAVGEIAALIPVVIECMQSQISAIKPELKAIVLEIKECIADLAEN